MSYPKFGSIPRWYKQFTISEKVDGTNGLVAVYEQGIEYDLLRAEGIEPVGFAGEYAVFAGSRNRWLTTENDNAGFAKWVQEHCEDAALLGTGLHYGEWYGSGIQRGYGLTKGDKRFALFNSYRWEDPEVRPPSFDVVPVLWEGSGDDIQAGIDAAITTLVLEGSILVPGFRNPEGIVIYSHEAKSYWKKTLANDRIPKDLVKK
jgi:hypothetical protein